MILGWLRWCEYRFINSKLGRPSVEYWWCIFVDPAFCRLDIWLSQTIMLCTPAPIWIICMLHCRKGHVSVCPKNASQKPFEDPLIGRAEHLRHCSRLMNLCLVHPDGAQLKPIKYDFTILQWCKHILSKNIEKYREFGEYSRKKIIIIIHHMRLNWSWENQLQFSAGL